MVVWADSLDYSVYDAGSDVFYGVSECECSVAEAVRANCAVAYEE